MTYTIRITMRQKYVEVYLSSNGVEELKCTEVPHPTHPAPIAASPCSNRRLALLQSPASPPPPPPPPPLPLPLPCAQHSQLRHSAPALPSRAVSLTAAVWFTAPRRPCGLAARTGLRLGQVFGPGGTVLFNTAGSRIALIHPG